MRLFKSKYVNIFKITDDVWALYHSLTFEVIYCNFKWSKYIEALPAEFSLEYLRRINMDDDTINCLIQKSFFIHEPKKEEAIIYFQKALEVQSDYLPATFNLAICLGDLERYDEAEEILQEVINKDASILQSYESLGFIYYKKGDFKKAEKNFKKILELDPNNKKAKNSLKILKNPKK